MLAHGWDLYTRGFRALTKLGGLFFLFNIFASFVGYMLMYLFAIATDSREMVEAVFPWFEQMKAAMGGGGFFVLTLVAAVVLVVASLWLTIALLRAIDHIERQEPSATTQIKPALTGNGHYVLPFIVVNMLAGIAILVGVLLFIIPGIIASIWYAFVHYVFLFEGKRGVAALKASHALVRGRFWPVFGRLFAAGLLLVVVSLIMGYATSLLLVFILDPLMANAESGSLGAVLWGLLLNAVVSSIPVIFLTPFSTCLGYAIYHGVGGASHDLHTHTEESSRVRPQDLIP